MNATAIFSVCGCLLLVLQACASLPLLQYQGQADGMSADPLGKQLHDHSMIFIGGLHRSGTGFLHYLVSTHPNASGFHDTKKAENEGQHLQSVFPPDQKTQLNLIIDDLRVRCGIEKDIFPRGRRGQIWTKKGQTYSVFASAPLGHLTEASPLVSRANRQTVWKEWSRYWDPTKHWLVEKSPTNVIRTRFLQELFGSTRTQFLLITRHPLTQVAPLADCDYFAHVKEHIQQFVLTWYHWMPMDIVHLAKCTIFRFEDLADDLFGAANDLYEALGLPPHTPDVLVEEAPRRKLLLFHGGTGYSKRLTFTPQERDDWVQNWRLIRSRCPEILHELSQFEKYLLPFGYSLHEPFIMPTDLSGVFPDVSTKISRPRMGDEALRWESSTSSTADRLVHKLLALELSSCK